MRRRPKRPTAGRVGSSLTLLVGMGLTSVLPSYGQEVPPPDFGATGPDSVVVPIPPAAASTLPGAPGQPVTNTRQPLLPLTGTGLRIMLSGTLRETFTDNAFESVDDRKDDIITTPEIDLSVHDDGPHYTGDLFYSIAGDLYTLNPSLDGLRQNLNAVGRAELIPQLLTIDARFFAQPLLIGPGAAESATDRTVPSSATSGYQDTYGYLIGPTLTNAFDNWGLNRLSLSTGGTFFSTPIGPTVNTTPNQLTDLGVAQNTIVNTLTEKLSSGPAFTQLQWDGTLQDTETTQEHDNIADRTAIADINYSINRFVQLLSTFGYEQITDTQQLERGLSGPIYEGGLRLTPGPRLDVSAEAGIRNKHPTFNGNLRYDIGARSTLTASYTDQITTLQQQLLGNLGQLGVSPLTNQPINTQTGLPFTGQTANQLSLENPLSRFREINAALVLHGLRTDYTATIFRTEQDTETVAASAVLPHQEQTGGSIEVNHHLTPSLSGDALFAYSSGTPLILGGGDDNVLRASVSLIYELNPKMSAELRYTHLEQDLANLSGVPGTAVENAIVVSITSRF